MDVLQKNKIAEAIERLKTLGRSQNAIAKQAGISSANVTQILKGNWAQISDELWRRVAISLNVETGGWQTTETTNYKIVQAICHTAQSEALAKIIAFDAGFGKTYALTEYAKSSKHVYYLQCERHYTRRVFLTKLGKVMGLQLSGPVAEMIDEVIDFLKGAERPLLILDEFDKVLDKAGVFDLFKTFYDALLNHAGFVLCGAISLRNELHKRVQRNKIGYVELYSRCGRRCEALKDLSSKDVKMVCEVNGVGDAKAIEEIRIQLGRGDLRQLKHLVTMYKMQIEMA